MNTIGIILLLFLFGGFFGYLFERFVIGKVNTCDHLLSSIFNIHNIPFLTIYGIGLVLIYLFNKLFISYPVLVRVILITIIITIFEYFIGNLSCYVFDKVTWKYDGFISPYVSLIWTFFIFIFIELFDYIGIS